jgi:hypothetical protein
MNNEAEKVWKEAAMAKFEALLCHLPVASVLLQLYWLLGGVIHSRCNP